MRTASRAMMWAATAVQALVAAAAMAQTAAPAPDEHGTVPKPAALIADGVPAVPAALAARVRPYLEARSAGFQGFHPSDGSILISTRFGNVAQVHRVATPGAARTQLSFEEDRIAGASWAPKRGDVVLVSKDVGGGEFFQIYRLEQGRLILLTDGKSRNNLGAWSEDGALVGYSSTRRNGADTDLYVMDPRDPATNRMVAEVKGGGWNIAGFLPGNSVAIVANYVSVTKTDLYRLDLASGALKPIGNHRQAVAYGDIDIAPDGTLWVTSDAGSDFQRLGTLDTESGRFTPRGSAANGDVEELEVAPDGRFVAYAVNEAGAGRLYLLDTASNRARAVDALPSGIVGGIEIAEDGRIGFTFTSARSAADAYSVDPATLAVTRWTMSETGGLDPARKVEPELIRVKSFDGESVTGFLYRPDPARFPGKRPLIIDIHGGPEGQTRPGFQGANNYYYNDLGIAIFYPNVRGSTGFGKRFVALDNGPFKREDSVKDIGAFLDRLATDPAIDANRIGVAGGSYGGYMCYASAIRYADRLKGAQCTVAISNFVTFLENTQNYRRDLRRVEYGDERDAKQRAKLIAISPLTRVNEIRLPLYVVTGANDPRVPKSEADQIVAAVRANGGRAWHLVGMDEGHGFAKKANRDYQFLSTLIFWEELLRPAG